MQDISNLPKNNIRSITKLVLCNPMDWRNLILRGFNYFEKMVGATFILDGHLAFFKLFWGFLGSKFIFWSLWTLWSYFEVMRAASWATSWKPLIRWVTKEFHVQFLKLKIFFFKEWLLTIFGEMLYCNRIFKEFSINSF